MAKTRTFTIKVLQHPYITGISHEPVVQIRIRDNINGHDFSISSRDPDKTGALTFAVLKVAEYLVRALKG